MLLFATFFGRVMLHEIILNWGKSGNGDGQQQAENNVDWGKPSLIDTETIDGDNCGNFLTIGGTKPKNEKEWLLLFFLASNGGRGTDSVCLSETTSTYGCP